MRRISGLLAFAFAVTLAGTATAGKTTVEVDKVKDKSLVAGFASAVPLSCGDVISSVNASWNSQVIKTNGAPTGTSTAIVTISYFNPCTNDNITMSGVVQPSNGSVNGDLSKGHFDAVVPVTTDDLTLSATVTVNLNFVGAGPTTSSRDKSKTKGGGVTSISDFSVSSRAGTATGTVSGVIPLSNGPKFLNLVNAPSTSATLEKDANGIITITKKTK